MQHLDVMKLPILPINIPPSQCRLVNGSTHWEDRSKTTTELWDVVLVFSEYAPNLAPTAYRFLSSTQFGYGG